MRLSTLVLGAMVLVPFTAPAQADSPARFAPVPRNYRPQHHRSGLAARGGNSCMRKPTNGTENDQQKAAQDGYRYASHGINRATTSLSNFHSASATDGARATAPSTGSKAAPLTSTVSSHSNMSPPRSRSASHRGSSSSSLPNSSSSSRSHKSTSSSAGHKTPSNGTGDSTHDRRAWAEQSFVANATANATATAARTANTGSGSGSGSGKWSIVLPEYYHHWDFGPWSSDVIYGTNAGNMFMLESWMDSHWFKSLAPHASDMYGFIQALGPDRARYELERHYDTWITRDDVRKMAQAQMNHLRIPVGWWSFIPPTPEDGWVYANDLYYLERLLGWLYEERMFAILDIHGQVGGQSGDAAAGRSQGTNYQFFTPYNQERADQVIHAVRDFVLGSRYGRVVSSILPVNEPCVNEFCAGGRGYASNYPILRDFYERTYDTLSYVGIPMLFHHGWATGHLSNWTSFVQERDPSLLVASDNPYPAAFPAKSDEKQIWSNMCHAVNTFRKYPTKVISTEWSLSSGMPAEFAPLFYNSQAYGYGEAGGGCFWSFKVLKSDLMPTPEQWSWIAAYENGVVPTFDRRTPDAGRNTRQLLDSLSNKHVCRTW